METHRPIEDRLFVRFPFAYDLALRGINRLRPGSLLRRRLLGHALKRNYAAARRRDLDYMVLGLEPDCEVVLIGAGAVGLAERYHGHKGLREFAGDIYDALGSTEWTLLRIRDAADRMVLEAQIDARGQTSGVDVALKMGTVLHRSPQGRIGRIEYHWQGWGSALRAADLSE